MTFTVAWLVALALLASTCQGQLVDGNGTVISETIFNQYKFFHGPDRSRFNNVSVTDMKNHPEDLDKFCQLSEAYYANGEDLEMVPKQLREELVAKYAGQVMVLRQFCDTDADIEDSVESIAGTSILPCLLLNAAGSIYATEEWRWYGFYYVRHIGNRFEDYYQRYEQLYDCVSWETYVPPGTVLRDGTGYVVELAQSPVGAVFELPFVQFVFRGFTSTCYILIALVNVYYLQGSLLHSKTPVKIEKIVTLFVNGLSMLFLGIVLILDGYNTNAYFDVVVSDTLRTFLFGWSVATDCLLVILWRDALNRFKSVELAAEGGSARWKKPMYAFVAFLFSLDIFGAISIQAGDSWSVQVVPMVFLFVQVTVILYSVRSTRNVLKYIENYIYLAKMIDKDTDGELRIVKRMAFAMRLSMFSAFISCICLVLIAFTVAYWSDATSHLVINFVLLFGKAGNVLAQTLFCKPVYAQHHKNARKVFDETIPSSTEKHTHLSTNNNQ